MVDRTLDISEVVRNNLCYSCGVCDTSCHVNAISFQITNIGRLHPVIDYNTCTNCGECYKVCPAIDVKDIIYEKLARLNDPFLGNVLTCYLGKSINEQVYKNSQSGGLVTQTLIYLFENKLISYALVVRMDYRNPPMPSYFFASSVEELFMSQKSIYTPINLLSALKEIDKLNGDIAIVGLPCHLEGIESLLKYENKKYSKIKYKLGLICDGVLSYSVNDYFLEKTNKENDKKIIYRNKNNPNYTDAEVTVISTDGREWHFEASERRLLKEYVTPPRCMLCFNKMNIFADVVYGDPWGIKTADMERGESIVIIRTKTGDSFIKGMINSKMVELRRVNFKEIYDGQGMDLRKIKTKSAIESCKSLKFSIPQFYNKIETYFKIFPPRHNLNTTTQIKKYLELENEGKEKVVKYLANKIKTCKYKRKVKSLIKKILLASPLGRFLFSLCRRR